MTQLNRSIAHIEIPARMKKLPISDRGYPVPYFVAYLRDGKECRAGEGEPEFRAIGTIDGMSKVSYCHRAKRCWLCGEPMGIYKTFTLGPMCAVNRITSEPPSHIDCAEYAAQACPFLTQPRMRRNEKELPEERSVAGIAIKRNPGVTLLWTTLTYRIVHSNGILFHIGDPTRIDWWCQGRAATRDEVMESINSGLPLLREMAEEQGQGALTALEHQTRLAMVLVPSV